MLVRLLYASRSAEALSESVVESILQQSRRNNPPKAITGILCFSGDLFIQVLEGGRDEVCELFNTIVRDPRHVRVRLLAFEEIGERRFGGWTMGQVDVRTVSPALLLKYAEKSELDPFANSGPASMALLDELIATGAVASRAL
jgi:hypothetical protein